MARKARMKENSPQLPQAKLKVRNSFSVRGIAKTPMQSFPTMHLGVRGSERHAENRHLTLWGQVFVLPLAQARHICRSMGRDMPAGQAIRKAQCYWTEASRISSAPAFIQTWALPKSSTGTVKPMLQAKKYRIKKVATRFTCRFQVLWTASSLVTRRRALQAL